MRARRAAPRVNAPADEEAQLLDDVIQLAKWLHVWAAHWRPAWTAKGWRTPIQGDGSGFPDLILAGRGGVAFRELKSTDGRLSVPQRSWIAVLEVAGADVGVWRPTDWPDRIRSELEKLARPLDPNLRPPPTDNTWLQVEDSG